MELKLDQDLQSVAEFMQENIPASKLMSVAEAMPKVAWLLWSNSPQEPCIPASLTLPKSVECSPSQLDATV